MAVCLGECDDETTEYVTMVHDAGPELSCFHPFPIGGAVPKTKENRQGCTKNSRDYIGKTNTTDIAHLINNFDISNEEEFSFIQISTSQQKLSKQHLR